MGGRQKISVDEVKKRIFDIHGDVLVLDCETYQSIHKKALFVDKDYGSWWASPHNIIYFKQSHRKRGLEKRKLSCLTKYGCNNPSKSDYIKEKTKQTNLQIYGYEISSRNQEVKNKMKDTCFLRYGGYPQQNKDISLKTTLNSNNSGILYHWKTNEKLIWKASYELKVITYLNQKQIEYNWQPKIFQVLSGKTYRPDLFLINENKWIEIKGYFRKDAEEKWNWFNKEYPNSELWNKKKLKEMGIL